MKSAQRGVKLLQHVAERWWLSVSSEITTVGLLHHNHRFPSQTLLVLLFSSIRIHDISSLPFSDYGLALDNLRLSCSLLLQPLLRSCTRTGRGNRVP